jgi:hypothetical protein
MIPGRKRVLIVLYKTYKTLKIPLLVNYSGELVNTTSTDDPGLFLYSPYLASLLNIDILLASKILFGIISTLFLIGNFLGVASLTKNIIFRCAFGFLLGALSYKVFLINDLYSAYVLPFSFVLLFMTSIYYRKKKLFAGTLFLSGICASAASLIRIFAGLPVLFLFGLISLVSRSFTPRQKMYGLMFFLIGYALPIGHFHYVQRQKNQYLRSQNANVSSETIHVFWHNLYLGFGFTHNPYGIIWDDSYITNKVLRIHPNVAVGDSLYESTIKEMVLDLLKKDCNFIFISFFARLGIVIMFFLIWFGWLGLLCAYFYPKPWYEELAFLCALSISALPGILTIPRFEYLAGFISCTVIYTLYSFLFALNRGMSLSLYSK